MASSLHSTSLSIPHFFPPKLTTTTTTTTTTAAAATTVRCGPRSNRGPLVKGRILSKEAIHSIQSLKRASALPDLTRLIKSDLIAVLRELLRQGRASLAVDHVLPALRSHHHPDGVIDLCVYADVITGLSNSGHVDRVDLLVSELVEGRGREGALWSGDMKGLVRVVRGVVECGSGESTVRICLGMKEAGCGDTWTVDEYCVRVLSKGLKRIGELELASVVEREFCGSLRSKRSFHV